MAETSDHRVDFAYSDEWLENGFAISSFSLPVEQKVFVPSASAFSGLWGVFADSLSDAWGRLLVNCMLQSRGFTGAHIAAGVPGDYRKSGMGALTYHPAWNVSREVGLSDLDELAAQC